MSPGSPSRAPAHGAAGSWPLLLLAVSLPLLVIPAPLASQEGTLGLEGGFTRSLPPSGGSGAAASYLFGGGRLEHPLGDGVFRGRIHGGLAAGEDHGDWVSGRVALGFGSPSARGLGWGLEGGLEGFAVGGPLPYRAGMATLEPELRWRGGGWGLVLRGFGAAGRSRVELGGDDSSFIPPPFRDGAAGGGQGTPGGPPGDGGADEESSVRTADLWGAGGEAELAVDAGPSVVRFGVLHRETGVGAYRAGRIAASGPAGRLRWFGEVSVWDTPGGSEATAVLGITVPLAGGFQGFASGGRTRPDPVLGSVPVGSVTTGVAWTTRLGAPPDPLYRVTGERVPDGRRTVDLRLEAPDAARVEVVGDFTGWEAVEMTRSDGEWRVRLPVEPGVHHFGFRVDGSWRVPEAARVTASDEWGRSNAVMVVPESEGEE